MLNWGNFKGDRNLGLRDGLLTLQKRFVRILTGSHPISHADPLFAQLGVLKIDDLFNQRVRVCSYQLFKNQLPCGVASLFDKNEHGHNTRGARSNIYVGHSVACSIKNIAPKCWNALPRDLRDCPSLASFKERSKLDLLRPYARFVCDVRGCLSCAVALPP